MPEEVNCWKDVGAVKDGGGLQWERERWLETIAQGIGSNVLDSRLQLK